MSSEQQKTGAGIGKVNVIEAQAAPARLKYHFIKSNFFRVVHADGVWGGLTGTNDIHISIFSERPPLPKTVTVEISQDSVKETSQEGKIGVIREVEVDLVMKLETAKALHMWLTEKIKAGEKLQQALNDGTAKVLHSQQPSQEETNV